MRTEDGGREAGGRVPPFSEEAERALVGALLSDSMQVVGMARRVGLGPEAWYVPGLRTVAEAAFALVEEERRPADLVTATEWLRRAGRLEWLGGALFLDRCVDAMVTVAHAGHYLEIVRDAWLRRGAITAARRVEAAAYGEEKGDALIRRAPQEFLELVGHGFDEPSNAEVMAESLAGWEAAANGDMGAMGLPLPPQWRELQTHLGGLEEGVTIIAGRPSEGKSTVEDMVAVHTAQMGIGVLRVALDMPRNQVLNRAMCRLAGVSYAKLRAGYATQAQRAACGEAARVLEKLPMWITSAARDVREICTWARSMKMRHPEVGLLTVDHVGLVRASDMGRSEWDANARLSHVSAQLKALGAELGVPVLELSQLSRAIEKRGTEKTSARPMLSDLRDSGSLEQDAAKVVFVYRDAKAELEFQKHWENENRRSKPPRPVWLHIVKNQQGQIGTVPFVLWPAYFLFEEVDGFEAALRVGGERDV